MKSLVCMVAVCWGMVAWGTSELRAQQQQRRQIPGVKIIRDLEYSKVDGKTLLLDLYLPENVTGKLPMIVGIHGGGWAQGSKEGGTGAQMAREGYAVAVINYRLSGEAKFPAQIIDCKSAVRWLRANADKYNLDADRFGATGHSAGGHLVSLLATSGDVKEFDVGQNLGFSSRIQAAAPSAGPTDLSQMDAHAVPGARLKHNAPDSPESQLIGGPVLENLEIVKKINPINYVDENDPPFYIIHGDQDATVTWHQAELLFEALKKAGVEVHFHTIKGGGHSGGSPEAQRGMVSFFDEHLKGAGGNKKGVAEKTESAVANPGGRNPTAGTAPGNQPARRGPNWNMLIQRNDTNKDGQLSREEFPIKQMFDRIDANKDGQITKDEDEAFRTQLGRNE